MDSATDSNIALGSGGCSDRPSTDHNSTPGEAQTPTAVNTSIDIDTDHNNHDEVQHTQAIDLTMDIDDDYDEGEEDIVQIAQLPASTPERQAEWRDRAGRRLQAAVGAVTEQRETIKNVEKMLKDAQNELKRRQTVVRQRQRQLQTNWVS